MSRLAAPSVAAPAPPRARWAGFAVVTGASSGIGRALAESAVRRGHPVLAIARRGEALDHLRRWAAARHGVEVRPLVADLATDEGLAACREAVSELAEAPELVVLNAGFGSRGDLWTLDRRRQADMVRVNCVALVDLAAHALPAMVAAGRGALVVVSSAAAWQPIPHMATYAASKAFGLHFAEAVAAELRGTGVRALAICPGPTATEFALAAEGGGVEWLLPTDDVELVVRATWRALEGRPRARVPTGLVARASLVLGRLAPRGLVVGVAGRLHRRVESLKGSEDPS